MAAKWPSVWAESAGFRHARSDKMRKQYASVSPHRQGALPALGQENNRHRRATIPFHVRAKVMGLDYVLQHPGFRFLPTEEEKLSFFCGERKLPQAFCRPKRMPAKDGTQSASSSINTRSGSIRRPANVAFCFVDDGAFGGLGFDTWLGQYDALIRAMERHRKSSILAADPITFASARTQFRPALFWALDRFRFGGSDGVFRAAEGLRYCRVSGTFAGGSGHHETAAQEPLPMPDSGSNTRPGSSGSQPPSTGPWHHFSTYHLSIPTASLWGEILTRVMEKRGSDPRFSGSLPLFSPVLCFCLLPAD